MVVVAWKEKPRGSRGFFSLSAMTLKAQRGACAATPSAAGESVATAPFLGRRQRPRPIGRAEAIEAGGVPPAPIDPIDSAD